MHKQTRSRSVQGTAGHRIPGGKITGAMWDS